MAGTLPTESGPLQAVRRPTPVLDFQAVAGEATLQLSLPAGRTITVTLGEEDFRSPKRGWTAVRSDSELLDTTDSGANHLAIRAALDTIAEVLTVHLAADAFETG